MQIHSERVKPTELSMVYMPFSSVQCSSVAQSCPTLCDPMNHSAPGLPVHHQLPEFTQTHVQKKTHVHRVGDAIQPSHPLSSPFPPSIRVFSNELGYLFDFFLVSWGMPVLLWTFPLALLLQYPTGLGLLCFHFHSFLCIFWFHFLFLLWFVIQPP